MNEISLQTSRRITKERKKEIAQEKKKKTLAIAQINFKISSTYKFYLWYKLLHIVQWKKEQQHETYYTYLVLNLHDI